MQRAPHKVYKFGEYALDLTSGCLRRDGHELGLRPKSFELLRYLVENSGRLISKEELIKAVWPDTFVTDDSLVKRLKDLRVALGDDGQRIIKTVPRRGYLFVADVREQEPHSIWLYGEQVEGLRVVIEEEQHDDETAPKANSETLAALPVRRSIKVNTAVIITGLMVVSLGFVILYIWISSRSNKASEIAQIKTIAVLPFKPLVAGSRNELLEFGLADSLITKLGKIKQLTIRPTSSVLKYAGIEQDSMTIGQTLRVDAVLESSFQQEGDRLKITSQLVRVEDGRVIWSYQCDDQCVDILTLQDSVSENLARELQYNLTSEEQKLLAKRSTDNAEVYQLYLNGRVEWSKRRREPTEKAIEYFQRALEREPSFAPAYSGLADCYITLGSIIFSSPPRGVFPKAKYAAERAIAMDDNLAEAHASLAFVLLWYEWDFARAKREFERAIELDPKYATAHLWYAHYLTIFGHHEEAIREARVACDLDPTSAANTNIFGMLLYHARQYDQAIAQAEKLRELDPNFPLPLYRRAAYEQLGRYAEAVEYALQIYPFAGEKQESLNRLRVAFQSGGIRRFWQEEIEQFTEDAKREHEPIRQFAYVYSLLGQKDKAFAYLEKMYQERDGFLIYLQSDPRYDSLRSDPRFADLIRRVGLSS